MGASPSQNDPAEQVRAIVAEFRDRIDDERVHFGPGILHRNLKDAMKSYARRVRGDAVLMAIDDSFSGHGAGSGAILTGNRIYIKDAQDTKDILYSEIRSAEYRKGLLYAGVYINGKRFVSFDAANKESIEVLAELLTRCADAWGGTDKPPITADTPSWEGWKDRRRNLDESEPHLRLSHAFAKVTLVLLTIAFLYGSFVRGQWAYLLYIPALWIPLGLLMRWQRQRPERLIRTLEGSGAMSNRWHAAFELAAMRAVAAEPVLDARARDENEPAEFREFCREAIKRLKLK